MVSELPGSQIENDQPLTNKRITAQFRIQFLSSTIDQL